MQKNQESYPSSDDDTKFYDKIEKNVVEINSDEEKCSKSEMETLSAVIQEEVTNINYKHMIYTLIFIFFFSYYSKKKMLMLTKSMFNIKKHIVKIHISVMKRN